MEKEEKMWHQRSRVQWLQCGDKNTRFFHGMATQRKRKNYIKRLRNENGIWQSEEHCFSGLITGFYEKLFTSSNPQNMGRILDGVHEVVTASMNADSTRPYIANEVDRAIKEMAPSSRPRWDASIVLSNLLVRCKYGYYPGCLTMLEFWLPLEIY